MKLFLSGRSLNNKPRTYVDVLRKKSSSEYTMNTFCCKIQINKKTILSAVLCKEATKYEDLLHKQRIHWNIQ